MLSASAVLVLGIIVLTMVLFIWQLLPIELTAMVAMSLLMLFGLVTPSEAVAGFSNAATITVGAMFVLSAALTKSGSLKVLRRRMLWLSDKPNIFLTLMMMTIGTMSAFMNNTGIVALFLPVMITVAHQKSIAPSRLLIPLSYASQAGGVCSLIGTSTNLLANSIFMEAGYASISLFEMGRLGVVLLIVLVVYILILKKWLLPDRPSTPLIEAYQLHDYFTEVRVLDKSPLIGFSLKISQFSEKSDVEVIKVLRNETFLKEWRYEKIQEGDVLLVEGKLDDILALKATYNLGVETDFKLSEDLLGGQELVLSELMIAPKARINQHTLKTWLFRHRYNVIVLAIRRKDKTFHEKLNSIKLMTGDLLLIQGRMEDIKALNDDENFIILQDIPAEAYDKAKALRSFLIILGVILLAAFNVFPIMVSAILGCVLALITRCIRLRDAYRAIDWSVIFLIAGMLPISIALTRSGLAEAFGRSLIELSGPYGPTVGMGILYLVSALLTEMMTNNAAVAVLVPIAISSALKLGIDPKPFVLTVTFAASTSFMTPIGYQTNAMIFSAGGYRYTDFLKAGLPLNILFMIISLLLIPVLWPY